MNSVSFSLRIVLVLAAFLTGPLASASEPESNSESKPESLRVWVSPAYSSTRNQHHYYRGLQIAAGMWVPPDVESPHSFGLSLQHGFSGDPVERYDLLLHAGYQITSRLRPAFLAGVEFLSSDQPEGKFLKPVIGIEVDQVIWDRGHALLSLTAAYRVAQGTTGSIALNGGAQSLAARIFTFGATYAFRL